MPNLTPHHPDHPNFSNLPPSPNAPTPKVPIMGTEPTLPAPPAVDPSTFELMEDTVAGERAVCGRDVSAETPERLIGFSDLPVQQASGEDTAGQSDGPDKTPRQGVLHKVGHAARTLADRYNQLNAYVEHKLVRPYPDEGTTEATLSHPAETSEAEPKPKPTEQLRYVPPGHRERMQELEEAWQKARSHQLRLRHELDEAGVSEDTIKAIHGDKMTMPIDDPSGSIAALRVAVEQGKDCQSAYDEEEKAANAYLEQLAEPYSLEPPEDQWGVVEGVDQDGQAVSVRIPFTQDEIQAVRAARDAQEQIMAAAGASSGPEREFGLEAPDFPDETITDNRYSGYFVGMTDRREAVRYLFWAARAAENALTLHTGTAWEPQGRARELFVELRDLPERLTRYEQVLMKTGDRPPTYPSTHRNQ